MSQTNTKSMQKESNLCKPMTKPNKMTQRKKEKWTLPPKSILKIRWWERLILWFLPSHISCDIGSVNGDHNVYIVYKRFNGKLYILKERHAKH